MAFSGDGRLLAAAGSNATDFATRVYGTCRPALYASPCRTIRTPHCCVAFAASDLTEGLPETKQGDRARGHSITPCLVTLSVT
jgi:hypothetical protein